MAINKVVLIGDYGVGKTSLLNCFQGQQLGAKQSSTTRKAEYVKTWEVDGRNFTMTLHDTAGVERYQSTLPPTYFRHSRIALFVYSVDDMESMDSIVHWMDSISDVRLEGQTENLHKALVGNKIDLGRVVTKQRAKNTADVSGMDPGLVFEVSALTGEGVQDMFDSLARHLGKSPGSAMAAAITIEDQKRSPCSC